MSGLGWRILRLARSFLRNQSDNASMESPLRRAPQFRLKVARIAPAKSVAAKMPKMRFCLGAGRKTRLSSRRSPPIVKTRKDIHQKMIWKIGSPIIHKRILPMTQASAPKAMVTVWMCGSRLTMTPRMASVPRLPSVNRTPLMEGAKNKVIQPSPERSGTANIHFWRMATARSSGINTPRKPQTINGPCARARLGTAGNIQPMRSKPAHMANSKAKMARAIKGINRS